MNAYNIDVGILVGDKKAGCNKGIISTKGRKKVDFRTQIYYIYPESNQLPFKLSANRNGSILAYEYLHY